MPVHRKHLLIIDTNPVDAHIADYFAKFDFQIEYYSSLSQIASDTNPIALIINSKLVQFEMAAIQAFYHQFSVPLIIISDKKNEDLCVQLLEAGADDFLTKPINPRELHARINAISRRVQRSLRKTEQEKDVLLFANWKLYLGSRQLFNDNQQELLLSAREYDLLLAFVRQPQRVLNREFLMQITKNSDLDPLDRRIDVQISRLRQKIEADAKHPTLIKTIRNSGYLFTSQVQGYRK